MNLQDRCSTQNINILKNCKMEPYFLIKFIIEKTKVNSIYYIYIRMFMIMGKILAKAIYEDILIEPILSRLFLNLIIGKDNDFKELAFLDPELH